MGIGRRGDVLNILFCVEFYYPSLGGAQEVVRHLAERLVRRGHAVTVATSRISSRGFDAHNGVRIVEFAVSGNQVRGFQGDSDAYREFLLAGDFDVVLFYAAQQWTFDAAWPVMAFIRACKVLVPCGYSGLFEPSYSAYFNALPAVLREMSAVVYHAAQYRDVRFGEVNEIENATLIPNGADLDEFSIAPSSDFRLGLPIPPSALLLLTVGTMTGLKGHLELAQAFASVDLEGRDAVLILNGNTPEFSGEKSDHLGLLLHLVREYGVFYAAKHGLKMFLRAMGFRVGKTTSIQDWMQRINRDKASKKRVIVTDLTRDQLVQAYLNADVFIFASNIEYSPLVLFEACAAGLPFLSVPVGNAAEIAAWTGGGLICPAPEDERHYTRVAPEVLARHIEALVKDSELRATLGAKGRDACRRRFNWDDIATEYEALFERLVSRSSAKASENVQRASSTVPEYRAVGVTSIG